MSDEPVRNALSVLSQEQEMLLREITALEQDFILLCRKVGASRALSLAVANMEQAAFWARKHVHPQ